MRAGKPPALAHGAAALVALVQAADVFGADTQAVVEVAWLVTFVDASGSRRVQGQALKNKIRLISKKNRTYIFIIEATGVHLQFMIRMV